MNCFHINFEMSKLATGEHLGWCLFPFLTQQPRSSFSGSNQHRRSHNSNENSASTIISPTIYGVLLFFSNVIAFCIRVIGHSISRTIINKNLFSAGSQYTPDCENGSVYTIEEILPLCTHVVEMVNLLAMTIIITLK